VNGSQRCLAQRYRLEEVLGRGATGTVWAAYDEVLRRRVAVKEVPPPPGMPAPEADALRERTLREARSIAVLSHPNVVTLYDVVQEGGEPFVVMELLPSQSLARIIAERGPLDVAGAALVGHAVASALQAAHGAGITHRDVKPGNVLIGTGPANGQIKLTDFGIARNVAEVTLTVTGMTLGSPAFIAPEVASGGQVTPAADLWGLGAALFAAVQGHPPYDAGDALATVAAVVHGEVPRASAAGPLAPVIAGLMVKDPSRRLPLAEVRRMLQPLLPPDGQVLRDAVDTTTLTTPGDAPTGPIAWPGHEPAAAGWPAHEPASTIWPAHEPGSTGWASQEPAPGGWPSHEPAAGGWSGHEPAAGARSGPDGTLRDGGPLPLATDPGPLPFTAPPRGTLRRRSALATAALAVASALLFVAGAAGGFGLSRWASGAEPIPELHVSPTAGPTAGAPTDLTPQRVTVTNDRPGTTTEPVLTTFTIGVPDGWSAYNPPLSAATTPILATFVSPEGNRTITVDRLRDFYPKGSVKSYVSKLVSTLGRSVDDVVPQPLNSVGPAASGAAEGPFETSIRTVERGPNGAELLRTTLLYLLPTPTDLWVIKVTVPSDQQKAGDALFRAVVGSFAPL
jgi:eukaryotic-like serine/threonine-protein kinase